MNHMNPLVIENDGADITATNFWQTEMARAGGFYLSINAGAFRLLAPVGSDAVIREMRAAEQIVVTRGRWPEARGEEAMEIMFDDHSNEPFVLTVGPGQFDRLPPAEESGRVCAFTIWTLKDGKPHCAYRGRCGYRVVRNLPCQLPWA